MSVLARKEREKLARRQSIISAAKELFFEKGYQMTTMEKIAEKAELSKRTLYLYFKNKDDLYISVTIEGFLLLEENMIKAESREISIEDKIKALYFVMVDHCLANKEYFRIFEFFFTDQARENIPPKLNDTINEHVWKCLNSGKEVVEEGIDAGVFREDLDPVKFSILMWRTAAGILDLAVLKDLTRSEKETYRELFEENVDLLIRGAKNQ